MGGRIAGISAPARTDLAVLKPFRPSTTGPDPMLLTRWELTRMISVRRRSPALIASLSPSS